MLPLTLLYPSRVCALEITSRKSNRHVEATGTGAFFVPAPGLVWAAALDGFESKERNIWVFVDNLGGSLDDIAKGFTEESFKAMGMEMKSKGEFTVNGARAYLFKVLHPDGGINWGKWVMLAENGKNTITVNAVFISGDADAAVDLEVMLKSIYMEPPRPVSAITDKISKRPAPKRVSSRPLSADVSTGEALPKKSSIEPNGAVSADLTERDRAAAPNDAAVSPDIGGRGGVFSNKSDRKTNVRIITENGVVSVGGTQAAASDGENVSSE
ncbi:MAG: hypothetical protein LBU13_01390 [Synergistaceae bacterium]|nr:hypothetical protein [Synergistaceae bacterium]